MRALNINPSLATAICALALQSVVIPAQAAPTWTRIATQSGSICPTGYIRVDEKALPSGVVVPKFCVMKYEAKKANTGIGDRSIGGSAGTTPVSVAAGTPWVSLTWQDARSACAATGSQLISENQWLSLAHQVTAVGSNWSGGAVGSGFLYSGHNDNAPAAALAASTDDSDGYNGTGDTASNPGDSTFNNFPSNAAQAYQGQRRTLTLPNGQVIWDLAGNVWEWTDATIAKDSRYHGGTSGWLDFSSATNLPLDKKPPATYGADHGMGRYYDGGNASGAYNNVTENPDNCVSNGGYCAPTAAFFRGGYWGDGSSAGVFTLNLGIGRSYTSAYIGFRCTR